MDGNRRGYDHQILTGANDVQSLDLPAGNHAFGVYLSAEDVAGIRFTFNGTTPSSTVGHELQVNQFRTFERFILTKLQFFLPTSAVLQATLYE